MPPAAGFVALTAASPFFRGSNIIIYHKGLAEVSWMETNVINSVGCPLHCAKEICVGTYIEVFDDELSIQTWRLNAPYFYGWIQEFIGYNEDYVAAVVRVMTYYRRYGVRLDSYWAGQPRSSSQTNHEETIIIL